MRYRFVPHFFCVAVVCFLLSSASAGQTFASTCVFEPTNAEACSPAAEFPARDHTAESRISPRAASGGTDAERENGEKFHWRRALQESFTLLVIEQAYVVHTDFRWVVSENGIPFNHYWRDYLQSLHAWKDAGWSDGDPNMFGYLGHPVQGAFTSYIFIQNDPKSQRLEFSNTKTYWKSRLKATLWNAVYSTQWNIGPLSEVTVEKYGTKVRSPWNRNGSWPCTSKDCFTGVGQIDLVMTPIGGLGWLVGEEWMDKNITRRVEKKTSNRFLIDTVRCFFNPIRAGANVLHGDRPWFRPRDRGDWHPVIDR